MNKPKYDSEIERLAQTHLAELGYEFDVHHSALPGTPDLVLRRERIIINVHGCRYHLHKNCTNMSGSPEQKKSWESKYAPVAARDRRDQAAQLARGFRVLTLWGCSLRSGATDVLRRKIVEFVAGSEKVREIGRRELLAEFMQARNGGGQNDE